MTGKRRAWLREVLTLAVFMAGVGAARSSLADHDYVPTGSMIPTVEIGDRVVVNKLAYGLRLPFSDQTLVRFGGPRPGDVVVLISPEDGNTLLKRVVAVPGDTVAVRGGQLRRNGVEIPITGNAADGLWEALGSGHRVRLTRRGGEDLDPVRLGADQYLVLGDNRGESQDGRAFGLVDRRAFRGRAVSIWMRDGSLCWRRL